MVNPVLWQEHFLGRKLWQKQREIVRSIARYRTISIKGCHGSGKTFCTSGVVPYELAAYEESIVLVLAPTLRQVKTFWGEVCGAIGKLPYAVPEPGATKWHHHFDLQRFPSRYAQGFSSSRGVNAQGFHAKRVTILADEAIGIGQDIWDAVEGIRSAGDVRVVRLCNPTVPGGEVYEDFTKRRGAPGHKCITISAFDTPNLVGLDMEKLLQLSEEELDFAPFPHLVRRRWVKEMYYKWGPQNPRFVSRVMGEFPTQATDAVFQLAWIEKASLPYEQADLAKLLVPGVFIQVGVDVAGPGDDETSVTARIGQYVIGREAWIKPDAIDETLSFLGGLHARFPGVPVIVLGDTVGIGFHFMSQIAKRGYMTYGFVAGAAPLNPAMFVNAKAEQYWCLREWMREGLIHGVEDEDTQAQLSDVRYRETAAGRIEIEHKDEARGRGSHSPDRAESLIMAFARIVQASQTVQIGNPNYQISPV